MSTDNNTSEVIDVEPQVIEDPQAPPPGKSKGGMTTIIGLCVAALLLGAAGGGWLYRGYLANYLPSDQLQAVQSKLDALEAASKESQKRADAFVALTEELKAQLGAAQSAAEKADRQNVETSTLAQGNAIAIGDLKLALEKASKTIDELKTKASSGSADAAAPVSDAALAARVDQLEKDVSALKSAPPVANPGLDVAAVQQAYDNLKAKIEQGVPYSVDFSALQALVPAAAGLDVIGAESANGLPNVQQLAAQLSALIAQLPQAASSAATQDNSLWGQVSNAISTVVSIKTLGESDVGVAAAQALAAVQAGDLQKASDALASATATMPDSLKAWADTLQRRLKLDQAMAALAAGLSHLPQVKG
ncbi:hypothetical protein [Aestuariivirga litoralis]|uniref:hypothetical protein n=1 Tax=Aestuariivirga litoralis TaxID=2650924 RepID=UPI0018C52E00|nr:hypothetical protein [Aestuariivirga litoralis]MBG1232500.1 hypothetical protein [Aestuariivirga litoralis]